ncbi:MAG: TenA family protein [Alphaproteobacteria bacterium]|nr:TenA family protein [Alphaproteobacteria bacterium]
MPASPDSFTEYLRQTHLVTWQNATNNRFTDELVSDSIDPKVYARYLTLDYAFIDGLVATFGHAVAVAPGMPAKARFSGFLAMLTSEENDYFLRTFKAFGLPAPNFENPVLHPVVDDFNALMAQQRAAGSYLDVLAVLVSVEWVYLQWATDAVESGARAPERFYISEWISLHADPAFADFVNWMRSELDREAAQADDCARAQAEAAFVRALELEIYFFAAPYEDC